MSGLKFRIKFASDSLYACNRSASFGSVAAAAFKNGSQLLRAVLECGRGDGPEGSRPVARVQAVAGKLDPELQAAHFAIDVSAGCEGSAGEAGHAGEPGEHASSGARTGSRI